MSETTENLKAAFAGESQANRKYLAFAKMADSEGKKQIAKLFRAAADAETVHAHNYLNVLKSVKTTKENLEEAIAGETHEFSKMYPDMISKAEEEKELEAKESFNKANQVEQVHAALYQDALAAVESEKDMVNAEIRVCQVCGNTFVGSYPDNCNVCGVTSDNFKLIE